MSAVSSLIASRVRGLTALSQQENCGSVHTARLNERHHHDTIIEP